MPRRVTVRSIPPSRTLRPQPSRRCRICNAPIDARNEAPGGICAKPRCRRRATRQDDRRWQEEQAEKRRRNALLWRRHLATRVRAAAEPSQLAILPSNDDPLTRLSQKRRASFQAHLIELLESAFKEKPPATSPRVHPPSSGGDRRQVPASAEVALLRLACATCRGHCCGLGGDQAFLDTEVIQRYRAHHPDAGPEDILIAYMKELPARHYYRSCVYHGRHGCALPREMRADICNDFYCEGLRDLRVKLRDTDSSRVFAVTTTRTEPRRAAFFEARGILGRFRRRRVRRRKDDG